MQSRIAGTGLASLFVLFALVLLLIERAPPIVAALALLFAALGASWTAVRDRAVAAPYVWLIGGFVVWLVVSVGWSIAGAEAAKNSLRIAAMIVAAAALPIFCLSQSADAQNKAARWALVASCLAIGLLLVEAMFDMPLLRTSRYLFNSEIFTDRPPNAIGHADGITYYPNLYLSNRLTHLASIVAILTLPAFGYLWSRGMRMFAAMTVLASTMALMSAPAHAPLVAAVIGVVIGALVLIPPVSRSRWFQFLLAGAISVGVVASPWLAQTAFTFLQSYPLEVDPSLLHRFAMWDYTAGLIADRPVIGGGVEAARALGREGADLGQLVPGHTPVFQALPLHPHNASIQIWLELGGIGALIFALFLFVMTRTVFAYTDQTVARASLVGAWVSGLVIAHLSYGIWQYWWVASLGLLGAMLALMFAPERKA